MVIAHAQKPGILSATSDMIPRRNLKRELGKKVSTSLLPYNVFLTYEFKIE